MAFLNTIVEFEGPVIDVQPRYWAAHRAAADAGRFTGPDPDEFWRLVKTDAPPGKFIPAARPAQLAEYLRIREEKFHSSELMALDQPQNNAAVSLKVLKQMGGCHMITAGRNREGINAVLNRDELWLQFDKKVLLPVDRDRRVEAIKELVGSYRQTVAVVSSVPVAYAAGEAGCLTIGVTSGPAYPKQLRQVGVDVFFDSLDALTDALGTRHPDLERLGLV